MGFRERKRTTFVTIVGGKFRIQTEKNTPGSIKRLITDRNGKVTNEKWEFVFDELVCFIKGVTDRNGKFGRETQVHCEIENNEEVLIQLSENSKYSSDFLKRVPNVDPEKHVVLAPFDFENTEGKKIQGILIYQDGEKVTNFYRDSDGNPANGIPVLEPEQYEKNKGNSNFWSYWFGEEYTFLLNQAIKLNFDVKHQTEIPAATYKSKTKDAFEKKQAEVKADINRHKDAEESYADDFNPNESAKDMATDEDDLPF